MKQFYSIKKVTLLAATIFLLSTAANAQTFSATYDFSLVTATSGTIDPTPPPTATGITFGAFSMVGNTNSSTNAGGRFSSQGWPLGSTNGATSVSSMTGALVATQYYEVTLTPQSGFAITLDSIKFTLQRSATGIRSYAVRSSLDGFINNLTATVIANTTSLSVQGTNEFFIVSDAAALPATNGSAIYLAGVSSNMPITFRFYAWNAEANGGTFSIDNVNFKGSLLCSILAPSITVCTGYSGTLTASGASTYTWNTGDNTPSIVVSPTSITVYTVTGTSAQGCVSSTTTQVNVTSSPSITVNSASVCAGSSATLTASGVGSYTWSTGANTNTLVVSPTTNTNYVVSGELTGCSGVFSGTAEISILPSPSVSITAVSSPSVFCVNATYTLIASGATSYSWNTGSPSSAAVITPTNSSITFTYIAMGTNTTNCSASAQFTLHASVCTGIADVSADVAVSIYPNPAKESVELSFANSANKNISIINTLGQVVYAQNTNDSKVKLDVSSFPQGIYFISITANNQKAIKKLVVQ